MLTEVLLLTDVIMLRMTVICDLCLRLTVSSLVTVNQGEQQQIFYIPRRKDCKKSPHDVQVYGISQYKTLSSGNIDYN